MNKISLWRRISRYVIRGQETPKVDLKLKLDLSKRTAKAEFAKDVTAIANTPGGDGFLIIGVQDQKDRQSEIPLNYIPGFRANPDPESFHRQMIQALTQFCNRVPTVEYDETCHPEVDRFIGVITIKRSTKRPHSLIRGSGNVEQDQIWIRRGSDSYPASVNEIEEMMGKTEELTPSTVINLSAHPLNDKQRGQIQQEDIYIEEEIYYPLHFQPPPIRPQIEEAIEKIGLTLEEWQGNSIVLIVPGLAPASAALLAYVHGLRGGFPKVLWIGPHQTDAGQYVIKELVRLQEIRDIARTLRVKHQL